MKASILIAALACLLIAATSAAGQSIGDRAPEGISQPGSGGETRLLQHLLQMNDAELVNLRQTVERIEKMSPQEKTLLRERIGKFDSMAPGKVAAMRKKFEAIPKQQREAMRERWMAMSPEGAQNGAKSSKKCLPQSAKPFLKSKASWHHTHITTKKAPVRNVPMARDLSLGVAPSQMQSQKKKKIKKIKSLA